MKNRKWWLFASLLILLLVIIVVDGLEDVAEVEQKQEAQYLPPVSIVNPQPQDNTGVIRTYAEIKPRWETTLKSQVSGEVEKVFAQAFVGERVKKGDMLIHIEASRYLADLHDAEQMLAEAELNLLQEKNRASQNSKNWQRSGLDKTPSDLVLNIPQLNVAEKTVAAAKSRVDAARKMFSYTQITAPLSGVITARNVNIGQTLLEGEDLLHIIQDTQQEIAVALSEQQWSMLDKDWSKKTASVRNMSGVEIAQARIERGGFLDPETRLYRLFLTVDKKSDNRALPGHFVQVNLPGRPLRNSLVIPESALTRSGLVWYLDDSDYLRSFHATVLLHQGNQVIVEAPGRETLEQNYPSRWRIATTPLASFMAGRRVNPVASEGE